MCHAGGPVPSEPQVRFRDVTLMHEHFRWTLQSEVTESCAETGCLSGFSPDLAAFESGPGGFTLLSGNPKPATPGGFRYVGPTPATDGGITFYSDSLDYRLGKRVGQSDDPTIYLLPRGASLCGAVLHSKL